MKYFKYDQDCLKDVLIKCLGPEAKNLTVGVFPSASIRKAVIALKKFKEQYKKKILIIDEMSAKEILKFLFEYYVHDVFAINEKDTSILKKNLKNEIWVKTNCLMVKNKKALYSKVLVLTNNKELENDTIITFEQLQEMINSGEIVVKSCKKYGFAVNKLSSRLIDGIVPRNISKKLFFATSNDKDFDELTNQNPQLTHELCEEINIDEIKNDFLKILIPEYKECLRYLLECAKTSQLHEQHKRATLNNEIRKSVEVEKAYDEVVKNITDTSKGR